MPQAEQKALDLRYKGAGLKTATTQTEEAGMKASATFRTTNRATENDSKNKKPT